MPATSIPGPASPPDGGQYRIAAVSALTGIPVPTIRIWEFRYQAVRPARSSGNSRLYSRADVDRLLLLKAVVDAGFQIGTVAQLADTQLRERLQTLPHRPAAEPAQRPLAIVVGELLAARLASASSDATLAINAVFDDLESLPPSLPKADYLLAELPTLTVAAVQSLRRARVAVRPQVTVVLYSYATRRTLEQLDQEGVIALSAPVDPLHLLRVCRLAAGADGGGRSLIERLLRAPAAPRRYDRTFLASLRDLPSQVQCECPNHLAELLGRLGAFEQYSLGCESRNQADALIHSRLYAAASHCREVLEQVLGEVLDHEGIAQPDRSGGSR
ncbi:MAG: hypothetical protein C0434_03660 [Xanthomonadaceae bacterium]|nr:hypothetical protein [Xanthomonadaceae bacterium]